MSTPEQDQREQQAADYREWQRELRAARIERAQSFPGDEERARQIRDDWEPITRSGKIPGSSSP